MAWGIPHSWNGDRAARQTVQQGPRLGSAEDPSERGIGGLGTLHGVSQDPSSQVGTGTREPVWVSLGPCHEGRWCHGDCWAVGLGTTASGAMAEDPAWESLAPCITGKKCRVC